MRTKPLLGALTVLLILTGCSFGDNSDQVAKDLSHACSLVNARDSKDPFIPTVAIEFFASAARANPDYIPLVQAAKFGQIPPYTIGTVAEVNLEILKARTMVTAFCTPRVAK